MRKSLRLAGGVVVVALATLAAFKSGRSRPLGAADVKSAVWTFDASTALAVRTAEGGDRMLGFLFDVDKNGGPSLRGLWNLPGAAPVSRPKEDIGRIYAWELLDGRGRSVASGEHFDLLAQYALGEEGACEKSVVGDHAMTIRVPAIVGAAALRLTLVRTTSDRAEVR